MTLSESQICISSSKHIKTTWAEIEITYIVILNQLQDFILNVRNLPKRQFFLCSWKPFENSIDWFVQTVRLKDEFQFYLQLHLNAQHFTFHNYGWSHSLTCYSTAEKTIHCLLNNGAKCCCLVSNLKPESVICCLN